MKLFKKDGYDIIISDEAYALRAFRDLWKRDRSKSKERAILELGYCFFMGDPRSDYQYITDAEDRHNAVILGQGFSKDWEPDKLVQEALAFYKSFETTATLLLEDTRVAVDKLRILLRDIDLKETDDKGKPLYTLNTIVSTIKQVPDLVKAIDDAERAIAKDIATSDKVRGSAEKSVYEDL